MNQQERAARYLAKLPAAVAGQGGSAATFAAACRLVEFGLAEGEAWPVLLEWNQTHCQPSWSEGDLRHKLADAFKATRPKETFMQPASVTRRPQQSLDASRRRPASPAALVDGDTQDVTKPGTVTPAMSPVTDQAGSPPAQSRAAVAPRRVVFPLLIPGRDAHFAALAKLRGLSVESVAAASGRGLLRFGEYRGHVAWFITDKSRLVAQARRLDGLPWAEGVKAWTLPGSKAAWPVGILEAAAFPVVALCEGGPDLLAAFHFILLENRAAEVAPVAMLGAAARIHAEALPLFAGKRVRIFRHTDAAGDKAANQWMNQLSEAGADVDAFALDGLTRADGQPVNDLNDLAQISADDFAAHPCLHSLFP